ncbi:hypothetical protein [Streptomyces sp. ME18-1-4]|uniref:hypothetical protein n=1 Tax=Streptomyces sp. ME18-1-4 TaxID=3028685 RepID=UPI0029C9C6F3|nr:hypothetical protein [Streptomyces sp. ME18-1-4]
MPCRGRRSSRRRPRRRAACELAACLPALHRALDRRAASAVPHSEPSEGQLSLTEDEPGALGAALDALASPTRHLHSTAH